MPGPGPRDAAPIAQLRRVRAGVQRALRRVPHVHRPLALLPVMDMNWDEKLGHKAAVYNEPRSMSCSIRCFSKDSGLHTLRILNAKGRMVYEKQVETAYGFNTFSYDMQVLPAQVHQFKPALEAAEDKKYYVVPGTYTIELRDEQGHSARRDFVLKERKKETHENKEERE